MTPQHLDEIHTIVIHTSATPYKKWITAEDIDRMHRNRKPQPFAMIGYHRVIRLDGSTQQGRPFEVRGAHVAGNNINTLGICLIGGLGPDKKPADTYSEYQKYALWAEIKSLMMILPALRRVCGHRDFSPDLNGDGIIQRSEWIKDCPCIEVADFLSFNFPGEFDGTYLRKAA